MCFMGASWKTGGDSGSLYFDIRIQTLLLSNNHGQGRRYGFPLSVYLPLNAYA